MHRSDKQTEQYSAKVNHVTDTYAGSVLDQDILAGRFQVQQKSNTSFSGPTSTLGLQTRPWALVVELQRARNSIIEFCRWPSHSLRLVLIPKQQIACTFREAHLNFHHRII
jgi:hypothetical protein